MSIYLDMRMVGIERRINKPHSYSIECYCGYKFPHKEGKDKVKCPICGGRNSLRKLMKQPINLKDMNLDL